MISFLIWLAKSSFCISVLYLVFKLTISRDKTSGRNRFALLAIVVLSAILPFANIPIFRTIEVVPQLQNFTESSILTYEEFVPSFSETSQILQSEESRTVNPWVVIYLLVVGLIVIHAIFSLVQLWQMLHTASHHNIKRISVMIVDKIIQPFSFFSHIVMSSSDYKDNKDMIIMHEYAHVRYYHWIDLLVFKLLTILHWFNPMVWFMLKDLKMIHEFQADQFVLGKGVDIKRYQLLIVKKAVGERQFALASLFTQKPILKRINMMNKKSNQKWKSVKILVFVPVIVLLLQAFSSPENVLNTALDKFNSIVATEENYDVVIYSDQLKVFNQECELKSLESQIINHSRLIDEEGPETIKVLSFADVSGERVAEVLNILNDIPYKQITTTIVDNSDVSDADLVNKVLLQSNGLLLLNGEEYSLPEFKKELNILANGSESKGNLKGTNVVFDIEEGVDFMELNTIRELLRSLGLKEVGPAVQSRWTRKTMRGNIIIGGDVKWSRIEQNDSASNKRFTYGAVTIFTVAWRGKLVEMELLKEQAHQFIEKHEDRSVIIYPGEGSTLAVIENVKSILKEAGFKEIEVKN